MKINLAGVQINSGYKAQEQEILELKAKIAAIDKAQAVIEFNLDGTIITANSNFLNAMGYTHDEVIGKHHSIFVDETHRSSTEYLQFWDRLNRGEFDAGEYKRVAKGGREVWIQATYNPILDAQGRPYKVVKFATDITEAKLIAADHQGQIEAIAKSQAVIEFNMDGTIISANDNFLGAMGYSLDEVKGRHHRMFVDDETAGSDEYQSFWQKLNQGQYDAGEFKRFGKGGKEIWIQASYNPILDVNGKPFKVVKYASDITAQKNQEVESRGLADLSSALKLCNANVMLADNNLTITYMNNGMSAMLKERQSKLREAIPDFDVDNLIGTCADVFHKKVDHQRGIVSSLKGTQSSNITVAGLTFSLTMSPWTNKDGERLGTVIEWYDLTEELAAKEKEQAIAAANARIKNALDKCQANVMLANNDLEIIYMNESVEAMLKGNETTLRQSLPNFDTAKLIGTCVDDFHANPNHQRTMLAGLTETYKTKLKISGLTFDLIASPIFGSDGERLGTVVEWQDITEQLAIQEREHAQAEANARIKNALDKCQANVMLADNDLNIIYMNESVVSMLKGNETQLRESLPNFNTATLIGTCVDDFHANPAHQRGLLSSLSETYKTKLKLSGLTFDLIASPIFSQEGERLGTVVEWEDITEELAAQEKERAQASANARIKIALDKCQANVMMADTDLNIIYMNDSVQTMLRGNENQLKQALPNFAVDKLIGTCVDDFHQNPAHQRGLLEDLKQAYQARLNVAGLLFDLVATPVFDDGVRLGTIVEWQDVTEAVAAKEKEQQVANENARIKQALDNVSTNTMIADADSNIIYLNTAIEHMMQEAETDIKEVLPHFDAATLLGTNMDSFHQNPAHQKGLIQRLETAYKTEISVGVRTFSLTANPILSEDKERIGTVVEWNDRTSEVAIEKEIAALINAAGSGDLSSRIEEDGKNGFFLNLAGGLNQLVGIAEGVINETVSMLDAMAHGDLTKRIESDYDGAFDKLKSDANSTAEKLTEVITRISNASSAVASGAEEIAQGNTDLSQRTEEQASSLEETASSMEQMTSTVRQNADNAKIANDLAADATTKAQRGGDVVKRAVDSMSEINESSKKIADIIGVIDEIAFQTNLLALNAAVEAARAGEQGRGFAVVAGEVRNLAQRSAAAAKEIKDLIRDSVAKVQDGSQLVNESGATLNEIVEAISRVTAMIADISNASSEQSEGIEQVNKAVTQMDEMTQQNAALVEEASAAGEAMADQARSMRQILGFFSTSGVAGGSTGGGESAMLMAPPPAAAPAPVEPAPVAAPSSVGNSMDFADDDEEWEEF